MTMLIYCTLILIKQDALFWDDPSDLKIIKQVNKSIEGTADDEDEGVPTEQAIRAGLELLKVNKPLLSMLVFNSISTETLYLH